MRGEHTGAGEGHLGGHRGREGEATEGGRGTAVVGHGAVREHRLVGVGGRGIVRVGTPCCGGCRTQREEGPGGVGEGGGRASRRGSRRKERGVGDRAEIGWGVGRRRGGRRGVFVRRGRLDDVGG